MNNMNETFRDRCRSGKINKIRELLDNPDLDPMEQDEYAWNGLDYACSNGHLEIVKLLLADDRIDPSETDNFALARAIFGEDNKGFPEIVRLMLDDGRCSIPAWIGELDHIHLSESVKQVINEYMYRLDGPIYNQNIIL